MNTKSISIVFLSVILSVNISLSQLKAAPDQLAYAEKITQQVSTFHGDSSSLSIEIQIYPDLLHGAKTIQVDPILMESFESITFTRVYSTDDNRRMTSSKELVSSGHAYYLDAVDSSMFGKSRSSLYEELILGYNPYQLIPIKPGTTQLEFSDDNITIQVPIVIK